MLFEGYQYTQKSVEKARNFILKCHSLVSSTSLLWISFQSNCVAEVVNYNDFFKTALERMIAELQESNFHFANLHANMRNSGPISHISLDSTSPTFNLAQHVPHLKAGVPGPIPCVLPVRDTFFNSDRKAILDHALKCLSGSILMVHDGKYYTTSELNQELQNFNANYRIRSFDSENQGLQGCTDELLNFLCCQNNEIMVTHQDFVTGIETPNVCFIMSDRSIDSASIRCTVFRAVENVLVIHPFNEAHNTFTTLRGFKIDHTFLKCSEQIQIDDQYVIKTSGKEEVRTELSLCKFCFYACQHEIAASKNIEWIKRDYHPIDCDCDNNGTCKIK